MPTTFSIVVPAHNRLRQLAQCLDALACLDYPRELLEVVVVDDASAVSPQTVVDAISARLRVTLLTQVHSGPASARNLGAQNARGEIIVFTDDDCAPASDWLNALATAITENPGCAIGGRTLNALSENLYSTASQLLINYLYTYYNRNTTYARFFTSNNFAIPRERFIQAGGFDVSFRQAAAEDREFCDRWLFAGNRMVYAPRAIVYHAHDLSFREFWRQHSNYGRGAVRFRRARARRQQVSVKVEPLRFYVNLLRYPFITLRGVRAWSVVGLLMIAQMANALGFCFEAPRFQK